jgi:hypothetical protein
MSDSLPDEIRVVLDRYPFLAYGTMSGVSYLGVVQNADAQMISMYLLDAIPTKEMREEFISASESWWWGSNRQIPINVFLKERFLPFRPYLKHFSRKDFVLESGPIVSLQEIIARRVRKRQITLVRRI